MPYVVSNVLIEANLQEELFQQVVFMPEERHIILKKWRIVDYNLNSPPLQLKN